MVEDLDFGEPFLEPLLEDVLARRVTVKDAARRIVHEMGRGGRILVVDESCETIEPFLLDKGYTVETIKAGSTDRETKDRLHGRVLVTRRGARFSSPSDLHEFHYGVMWLRCEKAESECADAIERTLMTFPKGESFNWKLGQVAIVK